MSLINTLNVVKGLGDRSKKNNLGEVVFLVDRIMAEVAIRQFWPDNSLGREESDDIITDLIEKLEALVVEDNKEETHASG